MQTMISRKARLMRIYDMEIDPALRMVRRGGEPIYMTRREFDLLYLLAQHQGRVVSRSQVRAAFYSDDPEGAAQANVVDVYIWSLRKKIDATYRPRLILTRRGEGYLLRGDTRAAAAI
jgi:DNA-binding response OmpR family regulator